MEPGRARLTRAGRAADPFDGEASNVTEVRLSVVDLRPPETLPAVCVRCGRAVAGTRSMRVTSSEPMHPTWWGSLLWTFGLFSYQDKTEFDSLAHQWKITKYKLRLPVCWWHRWFAPPWVAVRWLSETRVALHGAGDDFLAALKKQGKLR
jgi:hypothetical protein